LFKSVIFGFSHMIISFHVVSVAREGGFSYTITFFIVFLLIANLTNAKL